MLDISLWRKYNEQNNFRELITKYSNLDAIDLIEDDKELYAALKTKLTKKELKLFAMDSANLSDSELKDEFSFDDEELKQAKYKLYKKLKQDKVRLYFRAKKISDEEF
ncbi:MAG: hypothetical protein RBS91_02230 [Sulfurimonadaceae bacterium]|jgi:hypothetical protein|nr:hypothetical protein [Sulfurimonadaceae bacterium]